MVVNISLSVGYNYRGRSALFGSSAFLEVSADLVRLTGSYPNAGSCSKGARFCANAGAQLV